MNNAQKMEIRDNKNITIKYRVLMQVRFLYLFIDGET